MKCIIVDDNEIALKLTEQCISKVDDLELKAVFLDPVKALSYIDKNPTDLIFLDVEMPNLSGIEFLKSMKQPHPQVILTTTHTGYALESYDYNVTDYLVKPIIFARFLVAVSKARDLFARNQAHAPSTESPDDDTFFVKKNGMMVRLSKDEVMYIEGMGDYVTLFTDKEKFVIHSTMQAMEQKLPSSEFMRVHRSYIIRIDKINNIEDNCISYPGKLIPIGKTYREAVFKRLKLL